MNNETELVIENWDICIICKRFHLNSFDGSKDCKFCHNCFDDYLESVEKIIKNQEKPTDIEGGSNDPESLKDFETRFNIITDHLKRGQVKKNGGFKIVQNDNFGNKIDHDLKTYSSSKYLTDWIDNFENEITQIKKEVINLTIENDCLKDQIRISNLNIQRSNTFNELDQFLMEKQLMKHEIDDLKMDNIQIRSQLDEISMVNHNEFINLQSKNELIMKKLSQMETNQEKTNYGEYVWLIENISDKRKQAQLGNVEKIISEIFYSHKNGYKMCLKLDPDGFGDGLGTHISVFFSVLQGSNDSILQWPFKQNVTISLMNQKTGQIHHSKTKTFVDLQNNNNNNINNNNIKTNMSVNDLYEEFGFSKFISMYELFSNYDLCQYDQIWIKCIVEKPTSH